MARSKQAAADPVAEVAGLLTPEQFVERLFKFFDGAKDEDTIAVGELRKLLAQCTLPGGGLSFNNVVFAVRERVEAYVKNNPTGAGIAAANIWSDLSKRHKLTLDSVDAALKDLVKAGELIKGEGQVPGFLLAVKEEAVDEKENLT